MFGEITLNLSKSDWSDSSIQFRIPRLPANSYDVIVVAGGVKSDSRKFAIAALPQLTDSPAPSAPAGKKVSLNGTGFGTVQGKVFFNKTEAPVAMGDWQDTSIKVTVPGLPEGATTVYVEVAGTDSPDERAHEPFTVAPGPQIHTPQPPSATPNATRILLPGTGFGNSPGALTLNGTLSP